MRLIPSVNTVVTPVDDKILSAYRIYVLKICTGDNSSEGVAWVRIGYFNQQK